ncbi:hypothetical protein CONPUDRAFT_76046 [Coniophora puteana RWD-64-598 SS2]|uniref:Uncharacterized protein n=1 Tax=Coniophora puteana (strain RWD-64-598) TaxID=741705 RepID=A0A5M3ME54_CONPW|nr:uncharacterized protein CONPUDRAFT_76046 [Coniophora puteana RWD-64-598 SS2]EIW77286.1 hypothetical protein CONPUDRAFT_76046 [Coniophora puteana RWD-64-598 SS2]
MPMIWNTHLLQPADHPQHNETHAETGTMTPSTHEAGYAISSDSSDSDDGMPLLESVSELNLYDFPHEADIRIIPIGSMGILRPMENLNTRSTIILWEMNTLMNPAHEKDWFDFAASLLLALHTYIPFNVPRSPLLMTVTFIWSITPQDDRFTDERTPYCVYFHVKSSRYYNVDLHMAALSYALATCYIKGDYALTQTLPSQCIDQIIMTGCESDYTAGVVLAKASFGPIFRATVLSCSGVDRSRSPNYFMLGTHCITTPHAAERPDMGKVQQATEESLAAAEYACTSSIAGNMIRTPRSVLRDRYSTIGNNSTPYQHVDTFPRYNHVINGTILKVTVLKSNHELGDYTLSLSG